MTILYAVRSPEEESIISAFARSGYHHNPQAEIGLEVDKFANLRGKVWGEDGIALLDKGLDAAHRNAIKHWTGQLLLVSVRLLVPTQGSICNLIKQRTLKKKKRPHDGIVVLLWAQDSEVLFLPNSHLVEHSMWGKQRRCGYITPEEQLRSCGCEKFRITSGAVSLLGSKLSFRILKGAALAFVFVRQSIDREWRKMPLPTAMKSRLKAMEQKGYQFDVRF